jgi:hypothetical protein
MLVRQQTEPETNPDGKPRRARTEYVRTPWEITVSRWPTAARTHDPVTLSGTIRLEVDRTPVIRCWSSSPCATGETPSRIPTQARMFQTPVNVLTEPLDEGNPESDASLFNTAAASASALIPTPRRPAGVNRSASCRSLFS